MIGHQMPAASGAIAALAERRLLERRDALDSGFDPYRLRLPKAERVHRSARPGPAGAAVTIPHGLGRSGDLEYDRAAKAASDMRHGFSLRSAQRSATKMRANYEERSERRC